MIKISSNQTILYRFSMESICGKYCVSTTAGIFLSLSRFFCAEKRNNFLDEKKYTGRIAVSLWKTQIIFYRILKNSLFWKSPKCDKLAQNEVKRLKARSCGPSIFRGAFPGTWKTPSTSGFSKKMEK